MLDVPTSPNRIIPAPLRLSCCTETLGLTGGDLFNCNKPFDFHDKLNHDFITSMTFYNTILILFFKLLTNYSMTFFLTKLLTCDRYSFWWWEFSVTRFEVS